MRKITEEITGESFILFTIIYICFAIALGDWKIMFWGWAGYFTATLFHRKDKKHEE